MAPAHNRPKPPVQSLAQTVKAIAAGTMAPPSRGAHVPLPPGQASPWRRDQRFASFAERYVLERASTFRTGSEKEDAWAASLDARAIYLHIESLSKQIDKDSSALDESASG